MIFWLLVQTGYDFPIFEFHITVHTVRVQAFVLFMYLSKRLHQFGGASERFSFQEL